jgi:hypothetical protein
MSVMAMLRQLPARFSPPEVSLTQIRHSRSGNFVCGRPIVEPEPMAVFTGARRTESWPVVGAVPRSNSIRRDVLTPRLSDSLWGAVGNLDYETATPLVELNCQKIDPIPQGASEVRQ